MCSIAEPVEIGWRRKTGRLEVPYPGQYKGDYVANDCYKDGDSGIGLTLQAWNIWKHELYCEDGGLYLRTVYVLETDEKGAHLSSRLLEPSRDIRGK